MRLPSQLSVLLAWSSVVACIANPRFVLDETGGPATSTDPGVIHAGMVAIPETTLAGEDLSTPQSNPAGGNKSGGKGKGKGKDNGGGDGDAPAAASTTPSTGAPGLAGGQRPDTAPAPHPTVVPAFWLDAREVSVMDYEACVLAGGCTPPEAGLGCTAAAGLKDHPVNCVTFEQARSFCSWRLGRLPTYDEWSAAAAGSSNRRYPWGAAVPAADHLDACGGECASPGMYGGTDGYAATAPRGAFPLGRTPDGVDDLAGNVAEWVLATVVRGGSFADRDVAAVANPATRPVASGSSGPTIGLRCASD